MSAPVRLAVLGDPLRYTRSPDLHHAAAAALGIACESLAIRTPLAALRETLARLAAEGYLGCNLTMPLKEAALACMQAASPAARNAHSVNTVTFSTTGMLGDTTDGAGFVDLLASLDREAAKSRILLLGSGGAARSLALAIDAAGGRGLCVISRRNPAADASWHEVHGVSWCAWDSLAAYAALSDAQVIVNCTPLAALTAPAPLEHIGKATLLVDLNYLEALTPWVQSARARGIEAVDGLGLLVHQARHSVSRWFGQDVPLAPLAAAVGWPR